MASENETVSDVVKRVRRDCNSYPLPTGAAEMLKLVREIEAAHRREVETARIAACYAQARFDEVLKERDAAIAELRECLKNTMTAMCNYCRSTPEAKGLPCLNGCETMLVAKRMIEVAEGGGS